MIKRFKKIKIFTVFLLLLFSSLIFIIPTGKSGPLDIVYECKPFIDIEFNESIVKNPIIPYDEPRKIPIVIKAKIGGPAASIVTEKIGSGSGIILIVDLSIGNVSEGVTASINPPIVTFDVSEKYVTANATISVTIDQYLPAFSLLDLELGINSRKLGSSATLVKAGNFTPNIQLIVGYLPQLSFSYPKSNVKAIVPDEIADFEIKIENWGNGVTQVFTDIEDIPEGWIAKINDNFTLESSLYGEAIGKTISLNIKPPINFGYHEDRAIIKVKMTPIFYNNSSYSGEPHYLYFIVQSKGFSTPGFEIITIFIALIFVFLPLWKKKKNPINKNEKDGRKK